MGHRLSKSILTGSNVATNKCQRKRSSTKNNTESEFSETELNITSSNLESTGPTINVITDTQTFCIETRADSNSSTNGPRQIIIKIQLAKMESGDNETTTSSTLSLDGISGSNNNLNVERSNLTVNAISFRRNIACDQENEIKLNNLNVGSSMMVTNNNNNNNNNFVSNFMAVPYIEEDNDETRTTNIQNFNIMVRQMGNCQIVDNISDSRQGKNNNNGSGSNRSSTSSSEFSDAITYEVEEECSGPSRGATTACLEDAKNHCCRRKKSKESTSSACSTPSTSSACASKWICCKCTCRDALKKLRPSCSKKQLPVNELPSNATNSKSEVQPLAAALASSSELPRPHFDQLSMWSPRNDVIIPLASAHSNHLAMWSPGNDVIIPLASPQIVVVQYPPISSASQIVKLAPIDEHAIRLMTADLAIPTTPDSSNSMAVSPSSTASSATTPNGTVVHSQVDYKHWLVPDLERITKSTYYWGKMDRYEAERLLEGKPEGTFLLRDSAQEEYLFSVTFRKYGRSLHARIEQFNHQFSFDCHDPGVYIAPTVTGLLEHYKDPSIVMFFEPMLTIPLHRNKTFSLQQLCRATIVSQTTYDGISELEIPVRLKSYLKEYHYKQRVRKTDFDEPFYTCS